MVFFGTPTAFTAILRRSELEIVFRKIVESWPLFARFPSRKLENNITQPFVALLSRTAEKENWRFDFYYRDKFAQDDAPVERGEGDIVVRPYPGARSRHGFVFECKRLNVTYKSGFRDDADRYVGGGGMGEFLNGKYDLNQSDGGMLGYVMDNRISRAQTAINRQLAKKAADLKLVPRAELVPAPFADEVTRVMLTKHELARGSFTIYHLLLPYDDKEVVEGCEP